MPRLTLPPRIANVAIVGFPFSPAQSDRAHERYQKRDVGFGRPHKLTAHQRQEALSVEGWGSAGGYCETVQRLPADVFKPLVSQEAIHLFPSPEAPHSIFGRSHIAGIVCITGLPTGQSNMPDFDPSSGSLGVDEEVGGTPASTIRAARKIERRRRPLPQPEQSLGDAWILIAFIVVVGLIFVVAAWLLAGSDVPAEREGNANCLLDLHPSSSVPGQCPPREGRSYTCLSNGKLEGNIGECAGRGVLSHSPAERRGVELEFEQESPSSNGRPEILIRKKECAALRWWRTGAI